jgi:hypothetical protein
MRQQGKLIGKLQTHCHHRRNKKYIFENVTVEKKTCEKCNWIGIFSRRQVIYLLTQNVASVATRGWLVVVVVDVLDQTNYTICILLHGRIDAICTILIIFNCCEERETCTGWKQGQIYRITRTPRKIRLMLL